MFLVMFKRESGRKTKTFGCLKAFFFKVHINRKFQFLWTWSITALLSWCVLDWVCDLQDPSLWSSTEILLGSGSGASLSGKASEIPAAKENAALLRNPSCGSKKKRAQSTRVSRGWFTWINRFKWSGSKILCGRQASVNDDWSGRCIGPEKKPQGELDTENSKFDFKISYQRGMHFSRMTNITWWSLFKMNRSLRMDSQFKTWLGSWIFTNRSWS